MIPVRRLNHAVLYVRNLERAVRFYGDVLGFTPVAEVPGQAAFLRAAGSDNHHDLGLFATRHDAPAVPAGAVGLYHLAWEVASIHDLVTAHQVLTAAGALVGQSDHGATKSLYGRDPDGHEFEIMWMLPRAEWGELEGAAPVLPLDLEAEVQARG